MDLTGIELGSWAPQRPRFATHPVYNEKTLEGILTWMNPKSKQAMFSAASKGPIKRKTWDGCAWNKAGKVEGVFVKNTSKAAAVFGVAPEVVSRFISVWDAMPGTDEHCTNLLRQAIESVGLFTEAREREKDTPVQRSVSKGKRVIKSVIFKGTETRMREEFEAMMKANEVEFEAEATDMLCGVSAE